MSINPSLVTAAKNIGAMFVASGVTTIVSYTAKQSVPDTIPFIFRKSTVGATGFRIFKAVSISTGAGAIGGLVAKHAIAYNDEQIDNAVSEIEAFQKTVDLAVQKAKQRKAAK